MPRSRHFKIQAVGVQVTGTPPFEHWQAFVGSLMRLSNASMWAIGDAILYGEGRSDWGEMYSQAIDLTQRSYSTLANAASVCKRFAYERRRASLSFTHHAEVAGLSVELQDRLLDAAEHEQWSARDLRERVKEVRDEMARALRGVSVAVDDGDEAQLAEVVDDQSVRLIITCADEATAIAITQVAQLRNALVERVTR